VLPSMGGFWQRRTGSVSRINYSRDHQIPVSVRTLVLFELPNDSRITREGHACYHLQNVQNYSVPFVAVHPHVGPRVILHAPEVHPEAGAT
jgi:hypothetical protein